jgi:diguanylate cyclase (GGDEF)-like protein
MYDGVTGLNSRRTLVADLNRFLQSTERGLALLLMDMDHFKRMNDKLGHHVGDNVLRAIAQLLSKRAGSYRLGGDEFAAIVPSADKADATILAESIRGDIANLTFKDYSELSLTISVGCGDLARRRQDPRRNPTQCGVGHVHCETRWWQLRENLWRRGSTSHRHVPRRERQGNRFASRSGRGFAHW